ncbi:MAG: hypothetical protein JSS30_06620 [Verrucomicrobia bacterium]|nr:hypothetical protein [Verrucomicrobiota bacterium]
MKKWLIALAALIGVGVIALVIAQTQAEMEQAFDLGEQANIQGPDAFVGADVQERKAAAEEAVRQDILRQQQGKPGQ